jgi:hypothetical protein
VVLTIDYVAKTWLTRKAEDDRFIVQRDLERWKLIYQKAGASVSSSKILPGYTMKRDSDTGMIRGVFLVSTKPDRQLKPGERLKLKLIGKDEAGAVTVPK